MARAIRRTRICLARCLQSAIQRCSTPRGMGDGEGSQRSAALASGSSGTTRRGLHSRRHHGFLGASGGRRALGRALWRVDHARSGAGHRGGQHAIAAALGAIRTTNAPLAVPELTNSGVIAAARMLGIPLVAVRVDAAGLDTAHLDRVCRSAHPSAVYCAPAGENPIPTAMPDARRAELAVVAKRHKLWIIEDDAPGALVSRASPPMATMLPDQTLWLGSVAQSLGFGFRVAFVRVPLALESAMQEAIRALAWTGTTPGALLAARWLRDGTSEKVIRARRAATDKRHAVVAKILGKDRCTILKGIPYVWFDIPPGWRTDRLHAALMSEGVAVAPAAQFTVGTFRPRRGLRISSGALLSMSQYAEALSRIAEVCAHPGRYRQRR